MGAARAMLQDNGMAYAARKARGGRPSGRDSPTPDQTHMHRSC